MVSYSQRNGSLASLGSDLGVHYVLEGSVRREAGRVRIAPDFDAPDEELIQEFEGR